MSGLVSYQVGPQANIREENADIIRYLIHPGLELSSTANLAHLAAL